MLARPLPFVLRLCSLLLCSLLLCSLGRAQDGPSTAYEPGQLFEAVAATIGRSYYDRAFRTDQWPALVEAYRAAAAAAADVAEERAVIGALLRQVPASHLALLSTATHARMLDELNKREGPTFGLEIEQHAGQFLVAAVLEGGPAAAAGIQRGDRVLAIDGVAPGASARLDRSSDDAHLPDPPRHQMLGEEGERAGLRIVRAGVTEPIVIEVECQSYSAWRAAAASARTFALDGQLVGYVHYWYIHMGGVHAHFRELLRGAFADCGAVVLDLRGRGGDGTAVEPLVQAVRAAGKPVVALIDRTARSAKEVIAYRLREESVATLVGEHTARAVIPATFRRVGKDDVLMFPSFTLGKYTKVIEHIGVEPHVVQVDDLRHCGGADAILQAGLREAARQAAAAR